MSDNPYRPAALEQFYIEQATGVSLGHEGALLYDDVEQEEPKDLPEDPEMEKLYDRDKDERAKYKVEIFAGSNRSATWINAQITFWLSGRMLAGGGDDLMFICGYPDCGRPIPSDNVGQTVSHELLRGQKAHYRMKLLDGHWAVCPTCQDKGRNNNGRQAASPEAAGLKLDEHSNELTAATSNMVIKDPLTKIKYPCIRDRLLISATPHRLAEMLARYWEVLGGDADLYLKFNPTHMRKNVEEGAFNHMRGDWDDGTRLAIYSLKNIVRDTSAGADLVSRFKAFLLV